mgnify:FL=1
MPAPTEPDGTELHGTELKGTELTGTIEAICVGAVGELDTGDRKIVTAFVKTPVHGAVQVGPLGLPGDEHVYEHHGGPDMALLAYSKEHYAHWRSLGLDLPEAGAMGENLTTTGLHEAEVCIGDVLQAGTSVLQVTQPRTPCFKLAARYGRMDLPALMQETGFTGFLLRVLTPGEIRAGAKLNVVRRDGHDPMTVAEAARLDQTA